MCHETHSPQCGLQGPADLDRLPSTSSLTPLLCCSCTGLLGAPWRSGVPLQPQGLCTCCACLERPSMASFISPSQANSASSEKPSPTTGSPQVTVILFSRLHGSCHNSDLFCLCICLLSLSRDCELPESRCLLAHFLQLRDAQYASAKWMNENLRALVGIFLYPFLSSQAGR